MNPEGDNFIKGKSAGISCSERFQVENCLRRVVQNSEAMKHGVCWQEEKFFNEVQNALLHVMSDEKFFHTGKLVSFHSICYGLARKLVEGKVGVVGFETSCCFQSS